MLLRGVWDLPRSGTEPCVLGWQAGSLPMSHQGTHGGLLLLETPLPPRPGSSFPGPLGGCVCVCVCECPSHQAHPTKVGPLPWRGPTVQRNSVNSPWGEESGGPGLSSAVRVRGGGVDAPLPFSPEGASCLPLLPSSEPTDQAATPPSSKPLNFSLLMGCKG